MKSFFFNDTAPTEIYTLSLHDALPISAPTGKTVLSEGWKRLEKRFRVSVKKKLDAEDDEAVLVIPDFSERQSFYASPVKVTEHQSSLLR